MLIVFLMALALGMLGSSLKPIPLLAALVPIIGASVIVVAFRDGLSWHLAAGLFYAGLAVAELAYLATIFVRHNLRAQTASWRASRRERASQRV